MKLRITDKLTNLFEYIESGFISEEQLLNLIDNAIPHKPKYSMLMLSLKDYNEYLNLNEENVIYGIMFLMEKLDNIKKPKRKIKKMTIEEWFSWIKYIKVINDRLAEHYRDIPKIPMSRLVEEANKPIFNFGVYAIIDRMAVRHSITDDEAEKIPLLVAITKMKIDGESSLIRWRTDRAIMRENK